MLRHLHIRNFAIAPELDLDFQPGFTVITGETGAGKSILVDALGLLLGDRSDATWVRDGADRAELSAEFDVSGNAGARTWLEQSELAVEESCLLRRSIGANGRSRAWINGTPVTVQQLGELGDQLVEIHGQNEHLRLVHAAAQLRLLDHSGDYAGLLQSTADAHRRWKSLNQEFAELQDSSALSDAELDLLRYQHQELVDEAVANDELARLEAEHRMLSRSGDILDRLDSGLKRLDDDDGAVSDELNRIGVGLVPFEEFDQEIAAARRLLEEAAINTREAAASLRAASQRIDLNPERLLTIRRKLDRLGDLARKHRVSMDELTGHRDRLADRLERAENFSVRQEQLQRDVDAALAAYRSAAGALSAARAQRAAELGSQVTSLMGDLGMQGGRFEISVDFDDAARPSPTGSDRIQLLVSANPGFAPGPLSKIASGGELSRISLAIKAASAGKESRIQIFDEVDAGIGGDTANAVGRLLQSLSANGQALCVTHLAQVAACGRWQVSVDKRVQDNNVSVETRLLEADQRVDEIARMLGGKVSPQSRDHARELLTSAPTA
jgi:DNA repair protein RecN (Recombination protein N)